MRSRTTRAAVGLVPLRSGSVFRQEGEHWTVAYDGLVFRLRDTKGLHCVAHLLRHPGETVAAWALLGAAENGSPDTLEPLSLGPLVAERARVLVTKHIKAAIAKIAVHHPSLGHHFSTCIKTGSACAYRPDPRRAPPWSL